MDTTDNQGAGAPTHQYSEPDAEGKSYPVVTMSVAAAGALHNAYIFAMQRGAFNNLPTIQLHQLTGYILEIEQALQPWSTPPKNG